MKIKAKETKKRDTAPEYSVLPDVAALEILGGLCRDVWTIDRRMYIELPAFGGRLIFVLDACWKGRTCTKYDLYEVHAIRDMLVLIAFGKFWNTNYTTYHKNDEMAQIWLTLRPDGKLFKKVKDTVTPYLETINGDNFKLGITTGGILLKRTTRNGRRITRGSTE